MTDELIMVDSNILIYAHDKSEKIKSEKCTSLLEQVWMGKINLALSVQNLSEFYKVTTTKVGKPLEPDYAKQVIDTILDFSGWKVFSIFPHTVKKAIEISREYNCDYWDSLIAAVMIQNDIKTIYTENVKDFNKIEGIKVVNPLA